MESESIREVKLLSQAVCFQVWLTLADQYLHSISIDWDKTLRFAFNERSNPDDDSLGIQIVKVTVPRHDIAECVCVWVCL